jgi:UrcA family protein
MKLMIAAATASFIAGSLVTAASAEQPRSKDSTVVEQITYGDVDLTTAAGQKRLKDRIGFAAYRLCLTDSTATPSPAVADPDCSRGVMNEGLAQMERAVARANSGHALAQATISRH